MLPKMCRKLPCRNIEVKAVIGVDGCGAGVPVTPRSPWQATPLTWPEGVSWEISSQCLPGWVSS